MRKPLAALVACVAAIQLFLAHRYYGFLTGDDVEVLEEAFRRAIGLQHQPWDIRNLFVPDAIVAPVVYVAHALGVTDRRMLIEIAAWPFIAMTSATIVVIFSRARKWTGSEAAAFAAALLFAFHWIPLGFGSTVYPRTLATLCIVLAAAIVDRFPLTAGLLLALAFADRFSEIVFLLPVLIIAPRRWRVLAGTCAGILLVGGVYDWVTWGAPFRSVINFARLTLIEPDFASRVKVQSPFWYFGNILHWCAPTLLVLIACGRRAVHWSFFAVPLLVLSSIAHKEFRYVQAMIPFIAIAGGAGFAILWQRGRRTIAVALLAVSVAWDAYGIREFQRKSMAAVLAAQAMDRDPHLRVVAVPQAWAFGDLLYFRRPVAVLEVGTPPHDMPDADAFAVYRSDLDHPWILPALRARGYAVRATFSDARSRDVLLFTK